MHRSAPRLAGALILLAALSAGAQPSRSARRPQAGACGTPSRRAELQRMLRETLDGDDSTEVSMRRGLELPDLSYENVRVVADGAICERAARAYYRHRLGPTPPGGVAVARVGNRYVVYGANRAGEWSIVSIFTLRFEELSGVAR